MRDALATRASLEDLYDALDQSEIYCREARIALGVVGPTPIRAASAEAVLAGVRLSREALMEAGEKAAQGAKPRDTMRGAAWYRTEMVRVLPKRLAMTCLGRILFPGEETAVY